MRRYDIHLDAQANDQLAGLCSWLQTSHGVKQPSKSALVRVAVERLHDYLHATEEEDERNERESAVLYDYRLRLRATPDLATTTIKETK